MDRPASRVFRPYARWIIAHRVVVVIGILLVTVFLASRLGSLQVDSNPDLWAPQTHAYRRNHQPARRALRRPQPHGDRRGAEARRHLPAQGARDDQAHSGPARAGSTRGAPQHPQPRRAQGEARERRVGRHGSAADAGNRAADARGDRASEAGCGLDADLYQRAGLARRQGCGGGRRLQAGRAVAELHRPERRDAPHR